MIENPFTDVEILLPTRIPPKKEDSIKIFHMFIIEITYQYLYSYKKLFRGRGFSVCYYRN